jgi:hypothetical protein
MKNTSAPLMRACKSKRAASLRRRRREMPSRSRQGLRRAGGEVRLRGLSEALRGHVLWSEARH